MFSGISFENTTLVTLTGIVIVFIVLLLLIMIIQMFGKFFSGKGGDGKSGKNGKSSSVENKMSAKNAPQKMAADDDSELVAVITAAAMAALSGDGKKYAVRSIRPLKPAFGGSAWKTAGLLENTRPF